MDLDRAPRVGLGLRLSYFSGTSDSQNRVSPWLKTGAGCFRSSVARFAIALPLTSLTDIPKAPAEDRRKGPATTFFRP